MTKYGHSIVTRDNGDTHMLATHLGHGDESPDTFPLLHCWAGPGPGYKDGVPALWGHIHGDSPRILS